MTKISPDPKHSQLVVLVVVIVVVFVVVNDLVLLVAVAIDSVQCQPDAGDLTRPLLRGGVITLRSRYWVPNMMMRFTRVVAEIRASPGVKPTLGGYFSLAHYLLKILHQSSHYPTQQLKA